MPYHEHSYRTWIKNEIDLHHRVVIQWIKTWYDILDTFRIISLLVTFVFFLMVKESIGPVASLINPRLRLLYKTRIEKVIIYPYCGMMYKFDKKMLYITTHLQHQLTDIFSLPTIHIEWVITFCINFVGVIEHQTIWT